MQSREKGTADHYGPWAVFFQYFNLGLAADPKGTISYRIEGEFPVGGRGSLWEDWA